jgi:transposase InsO family protein
MISSPDRQHAVELIDEAHQGGVRLKPACAELGIDVRTYQRWTRGGDVKADGRPGAVRAEPANKLSAAERAEVLAVCHAPAYASLPPGQIVPRLADQGQYIASESSFYRILREADEQHHRGRSRSPRAPAEPPRLCAKAPCEVWTWDISWLPGPVKGLFFYLYLIVDLYSRKIVSWEVYECESADYAAEVVRRAVLAERCIDRPLVLHADNGSPMKGETLLETLYRLGIATSYSRPRTSNDNPYSEALFRTCKYRPDYPAQGFADLNEARAWMQQFARGYNEDHRHSGIRFVTPQQRHSGQDRAILAQRQALYEQARACHPQRWSGAVRNWEPITEVWLNPTAEVISHPVSESKRTDAARGRLATLPIKPTATVTRPASDREGWLQGAGGTPAYPHLARATTQSPDPSRDHSPSLQRA